MTARLKNRLRELIEGFEERYSERYTLDWLRDIWHSDRHSDYTAFHRTADYMAEQLSVVGGRGAEIVPCPADGKTRCQAWTMPLAWEGGEAILRIVSPREEVLCDRSTEPLSCTMWCEPTPPEGVRGPLIAVDDPDKVDDETRKRLRGAFILTELSGRGKMKCLAADAGAAAVVSHHVAHVERHPEVIGWSNGWSDDAGGWALKASDRRMSGFQISPPVGRRLRELLAQGPVTCEARVGGRIGEGTLPVVTGVTPGQSDEELLLTGHLYEVGALDNASGCAAMLEALRLMAGMPAARRRIRALFTSECYGTYAFYTRHAALIDRTLAGVNLDCVAEKETAERPALWSRSSEAAPAAIDALFRAAMHMTDNLPGALPAEERAHALSDSMLSDPMTDAPTICLMRAPWHWHCTGDDWAGINADALRRATIVTAAVLRWLSEAGPKDADSLALATVADAQKLYKENLDPQRRDFFLDRARARVLWTKRLGARRAEEIAGRLPAVDHASLISPEDGGDEERATMPIRKYWGAPTFDNIPPDQRNGFEDPRWNMPYVTAGYWADGERSVAQIAALVRTEFGQPITDLLRWFRVLERGGMIELKVQ